MTGDAQLGRRRPRRQLRRRRRAATSSTRSATPTTGAWSTGTRSTRARGSSSARAINKHASPTLTNAYGTPSMWQPFRGRPGGAACTGCPTLTGGTYTGQWTGGVERRDQRRLHGLGRRVPARQRHRPAGPRAVREAGDLADRRPDPGLHRADADADRRRARAPSASRGQRRGTVTTSAEGRGAARRDHRRRRPCSRRSPPARRGGTVRRWASSTPPRRRARPDLPHPGDRPVRQRLRRAAGDRHHPGRHAAGVAVRGERRRRQPDWQWRLDETSGTTGLRPRRLERPRR